MCGGVERGHLQRNHRIAPAGDGVTHHPVHMPLTNKRAGMAIIGAQNHVARIEAFLGDGCDLRLHIVPRAAQADHATHALPHAGNGVCFAGAFVIVRWATRNIGRKCWTEIRRCIVTADSFASALRRRDFGQHLRISG